MTDLTALSNDEFAASLRRHLVEAHRRLEPTGYVRAKDRIILACTQMREIGKQLIADSLIGAHHAGRANP